VHSGQGYARFVRHLLELGAGGGVGLPPRHCMKSSGPSSSGSNGRRVQLNVNVPAQLDLAFREHCRVTNTALNFHVVRLLEAYLRKYGNAVVQKLLNGEL